MTDKPATAEDKPHVSEVTDIHCPICKKGFMASKMGRYGLYWTCNEKKNKCRFNLSAKPTGRLCTFRRGATADAVCGALMVEGTKTIPERCSEKACPNRNPHKLKPA